MHKIFHLGAEFENSISPYFKKFILALLGVCYFARSFSSCREQGLLFIVVCGLLVVGASLAPQSTGCSSCGTWDLLFFDMWDPPGPWTETMAHTLAGRFLSIAPPGKSHFC